jgi:hypothetical protein
MEAVQDPNALTQYIILHIEYSLSLLIHWGHYATSRKVAGSSPDEVNFFNLT